MLLHSKVSMSDVQVSYLIFYEFILQRFDASENAAFFYSLEMWAQSFLSAKKSQITCFM